FSESLIHSLELDLLARWAAGEDRPHLLRNSLGVAMSTLQHASTRLSEAAQRNTETHNLLDAVATLQHHHKIKVAVQADRECVRSYRPPIQSSNFNTLSLILKTSHPKNLLFYLGSNTTVDFLAVEMHHGKVSLLWNLGSGTTRLQFPETDITNNRWTKINATSPQSEETSFYFDGSGFSVVQKSLRATSTSIVLLFKTLSPGGLLLYLASNNTVKHAHTFKTFTVKETHNDGTSLFLQRDFLSLELVEGHVRLTFDLGSGALIQTSNRKYNTGVWYKVTLQRNKRKGTSVNTGLYSQDSSPDCRLWLCPGYLSIMAAGQSSEKEVLEAESPGTASDLNRYDLDPIYIGGFPFSRPISVSVRMSVRSQALDGLMFLLSDSKQMDFVVLSLKGGRVMLSADLGKGPSSIVSSVAVSDGRWHIVSAEVSRKSVSVTVDDSPPASIPIKGNQLDVDKTLFLGGLPHGVNSRRISVRLSATSQIFHTNQESVV
ncbi:hypothetical protein GOODEAATRI_022427, partial [Goodea atripinnis]